MPSRHTEVIETLRLSRIFSAPQEKVFRAWTDPQELKKWWGPGSFTTQSAEVDLRAGGAYRITMKRPDGQLQQLFGTYVEVSPPERLVMTWSWQGTDRDDGYEALLTIEFRAKGRATEVVLIHEKLPKRSVADYEGGWSLTLDQLGDYLEQQL